MTHNKIKMKEITYFRLARFDPERPSDVPKDVTTRLRKLSRMFNVGVFMGRNEKRAPPKTPAWKATNVHDVKNFYLNKTDVIITVNTSKVFRV